ncbi:MAG: hypothetical protein U0229_06750 [Anaeromyxobacter sp.]
MKRRDTGRAPALVAALAVAAAGAGCALVPPTAGRGEAVNLALAGDLAYVALGEAGLGIYDLEARRMVAVLAPEAGAGSVDDLAVADGLLFALDARTPGYLTTYALAEPSRPRRTAPPLPVPVEPFSGVSASAGRVVVSGGTKPLTLATYGADGALSVTATTDLGRGQPDVLVAPGGALAFVSTHFSLVRATYGVTALALDGAPRALSRIEIDGAGFTPGAAKPANFALETALAGSALLVASGAGLSVLDASDPAALRQLAHLTLPVRPVNVDTEGGLAALVGSDPSPTLVLVDVSEPARPALVAALPLPPGASPTAVALDRRRIVVAARAAGVLVVNRDAAAPAQAARARD